MTKSQAGILAPLPPHCRYLTFDRRLRAEPHAELRQLASSPAIADAVIGFGAGLVAHLSGKITGGGAVSGLRLPSAHLGPGLHIPSTPADLWCWLRGDDPGVVVHQQHAIEDALGGAFLRRSVVDGFVHRDSRDLTGYVDGTENPTGAEAEAAAIASDGSSFVAVQQWVHDLRIFAKNDTATRDAIIGRRLADNEEIDDAPPSAHVKRTAQESFDPEAFILRRSMPWANAEGEGLMFVAFGKSFDAFEAQIRRMVGEEDGVADALFTFTKPVTSAYFWCPPVIEARLDLSAAGID